jgi:hypothetical protein
MARAKMLTVEVTNLGAVYVNNTRITGRDTKWGCHTIIFETKAYQKDVIKTLKDNGYGHIQLDKEYALDQGIDTTIGV